MISDFIIESQLSQPTKKVKQEDLTKEKRTRDGTKSSRLQGDKSQVNNINSKQVTPLIYSLTIGRNTLKNFKHLNDLQSRRITNKISI